MYKKHTCEPRNTVALEVFQRTNQPTRCRVLTRLRRARTPLRHQLARVAIEAQRTVALAADEAVFRSDGHLTRSAMLTERDVRVTWIGVFAVIANESFWTPVKNGKRQCCLEHT